MMALGATFMTVNVLQQNLADTILLVSFGVMMTKGETFKTVLLSNSLLTYPE